MARKVGSGFAFNNVDERRTWRRSIAVEYRESSMLCPYDTAHSLSSVGTTMTFYYCHAPTCGAGVRRALRDSD